MNKIIDESKYTAKDNWLTYPRVTNIIRKTDLKEDLDRIRRWEKKINSLYEKGLRKLNAEQVKKQSQERGTDVHEVICEYLILDDLRKGFNPGIKEKYLPYWQNAKPVVEQVIDFGFSLVEEPVWSYNYRYRGQLDLVCNWRMKPTIWDWTTSEKRKRKEWIKHKFIQAAAYKIAYEERNPKAPKIEQLSVAVISLKSCNVFTAKPDEWVKEWKTRLTRFYKENPNG